MVSILVALIRGIFYLIVAMVRLMVSLTVALINAISRMSRR